MLVGQLLTFAFTPGAGGSERGGGYRAFGQQQKFRLKMGHQCAWIHNLSFIESTFDPSRTLGPSAPAASYLRWPIHGNLDVTLMLVFVGGLRQKFDKTMTKL